MTFVRLAIVSPLFLVRYVYAIACLVFVMWRRHWCWC